MSFLPQMETTSRPLPMVTLVLRVYAHEAGVRPGSVTLFGTDVLHRAIVRDEGGQAIAGLNTMDQTGFRELAAAYPSLSRVHGPVVHVRVDGTVWGLQDSA